MSRTLVIFKAIQLMIPWYLAAFEDGKVTKAEVVALLRIILRLVEEMDNG